MTIEEIRKNAPDGATGYRHPINSPESVVYYKRENGELFTWCIDEWMYSSNQNFELKPL